MGIRSNGYVEVQKAAWRAARARQPFASLSSPKQQGLLERHRTQPVMLRSAWCRLQNSSCGCNANQMLLTCYQPLVHETCRFWANNFCIGVGAMVVVEIGTLLLVPRCLAVPPPSDKLCKCGNRVPHYSRIAW